MEILDEANDVTDEFLEFIKTYEPTEECPLSKFIEYIRTAWWMSDWGMVVRRNYKGIVKMELHTAGYSQNEMIINAIQNNTLLILHYMPLVKWKVGGHFYFEIPVERFKWK
jgi:hypothetical protein